MIRITIQCKYKVKILEAMVLVKVDPSVHSCWIVIIFVVLAKIINLENLGVSWKSRHLIEELNSSLDGESFQKQILQRIYQSKRNTTYIVRFYELQTLYRHSVITRGTFLFSLIFIEVRVSLWTTVNKKVLEHIIIYLNPTIYALYVRRMQWSHADIANFEVCKIWSEILSKPIWYSFLFLTFTMSNLF